jgi:hypothetical protein
LLEGATVPIEHSFFACELLPPPQCYIDVARIDLHAVADSTAALSGD